MIKTKKPGVTHKGKVLRAGALLSLSEADEKRLVKDGWAYFVEAWPAGKEELSTESENPEPASSEESKDAEPATETPEEGPQTDLPEEEQPEPAPKRTRSRKK